MKANPIRDKSYKFALTIIAVFRKLLRNREFVLSKQLLKSGTSIGANVEEALQGQSRRDFIAKLSISLKETHETQYWIRLLRDAHFLSAETAATLLADSEELRRLLTAIIKTSKSS